MTALNNRVGVITRLAQAGIGRHENVDKPVISRAFLFASGIFWHRRAPGSTIFSWYETWYRFDVTPGMEPSLDTPGKGIGELFAPYTFSESICLKALSR